MSLPALKTEPTPRDTSVTVNRLLREFNRGDRMAPIIGTDTGTATAYAIAPAPGIVAYNVGQEFIFQATHANTSTTPTLNVNSLGAGTITNLDGSALAIGDIPLNGWITAICTATTPTFALVPALAPLYASLLTTRGDLLARGASAAQRLALGGAGTLLKSNGTDPAWFAMGSALQYLRVNSGATDLEWATLAGGVRQVVSTITGTVATGTTTIPFDNTIPQNTEGDQYMSLSITPQSATSTLLFFVIVMGSNSTNNNTMTVALFQDSTANALAAVCQLFAAATGAFTVPLVYKMTSGTTSATTFKVRFGGGSAGTTTFNGTSSAQNMGGAMASCIVIAELGG